MFEPERLCVWDIKFLSDVLWSDVKYLPKGFHVEVGPSAGAVVGNGTNSVCANSTTGELTAQWTVRV